MSSPKRGGRWFVILFVVVIVVVAGVFYARSNSESEEDRAFQELLDQYNQKMDGYRECVENAEILDLSPSACSRPEYPSRPTAAP